MQKVLKNIKISSEVMNLKQLMITLLLIALFTAVINTIFTWLGVNPVEIEKVISVSVINIVTIFMFLSVILMQINTYRGLPLLKSFSVDKSEISSYYLSTTIFYSLMVYIFGSLFIAIPVYHYFDLTNTFAFGYYLGNLSFINYIKISVMGYSFVLLVIMLFQLFTLVSLRFGTWITIGIIALSIATVVNFIIPVLLTIRSGIDKWMVFGSIYIVSIIIFIICYYLQKGLEVTK